MKHLLPIWIGIRYSRSSSDQRFLSLLSWISLLGMILGVASLIIVLSVMNGFHHELRDRLLNMVAHGQIESFDGTPIESWEEVAGLLNAQPFILGAAPLVGGDVMLSHGEKLRAAYIQGIDPEQESKIASIEDKITYGDFESISTGRYNMVLGEGLARSLGLLIGDKVVVTLPDFTFTPFGVKPRTRRFTLVGTFSVGADMDFSHAYIHIRDARKLYRLKEGVHAIRYLTDEVLSAQGYTQNLHDLLQTHGQSLNVLPWTQQRAQLFAAVKMEKTMVTFMLSMIITVAAFNLISVLSMMVAQKRDEIAVLRMMGLKRLQVLFVFFAQGMSLAFAGAVVGAVLGVLGAWGIAYFKPTVFDPSVFYISGLPSVLLWEDVIYVLVLSFLLSMAFSFYPAYRAGKIKAVEALQYQ